MGRLEGKIGFITGGAQGIRGNLMGFGGAAAWMFFREGAKVAISDIDDTNGQRTAEQIREDGGDAVYIHLDVTREDQWKKAMEKTMAAYGRLDILVNNAGYSAPVTIEETTVELWDQIMAVHAKGTFLGTKTAIPAMRKSGGGSIINISSIQGLVGSPFAAAYHAAKGAVRIFTKAAAIQLAKDKIRVNSIHPGWALTPMTAARFGQPEIAQPRLARVPMGRFCAPEEVAYGIVYLASDESSFVTGSELVIDGGVTAQ